MHSGQVHRREVRDLGDRLASEYEELLTPDQVLAVVALAHRRTAQLHRLSPTCLALTENVARRLITDRAGSLARTRNGGGDRSPPPPPRSSRPRP